MGRPGDIALKRKDLMVGVSAAAALAAAPNGAYADAAPAGTDKPVMAKVSLNRAPSSATTRRDIG